MVEKNRPPAVKRPDASCPQCGSTPRENRAEDAARIRRRQGVYSDPTQSGCRTYPKGSFQIVLTSVKKAPARSQLQPVSTESRPT